MITLTWTPTCLSFLAGVAMFFSTATSQAGWKFESIELNPARLFDAIDDSSDHRSLSGGLHFTDDTGRNEIAIPLLWVDNKENPERIGDFSAVRYEVQFRRYFKDEGHNGLYAGPLVRYADFEGTDRDTGQPLDDGRLGVGVVFGQRIPFGRSRFYWGYGVSIGYLFGDEVRVRDSDWINVSTDTHYDTDDGNTFVDVEILKFGFRF